MLALLAMLGTAAASPLADALAEELSRSDELALPEAPPPYFVAYDLEDFWEARAEATLGGVVSRSAHRSRLLGVRVRAGSPELDNSNFVDGYQVGGFDSTYLVIDDVPDAIRRDAWLLTDRAYKDAVAGLGSKEAWRTTLATPDDTPDFTTATATTATAEPEPPADDALAELARRLSAVFLDRPGIERSRVVAAADNGVRVVLDTEGTRVAEPHGETSIRAIASVRAEDGAAITGHASWLVRRVDQLPAFATMRAEVHALADRLEAWQAARPATDEYVGPVVFQDAAAVDVFRYLLVAELTGTPAAEEDESRRYMKTPRAEPPRLKRRVLPLGWDVIDDPTAGLDLASSFRHDIQGTPAQRLVVIQDGVVRRLPMSRTPSEDEPASNGHARGFPGDMPRGMPSNAAVIPDRAKPSRKLVSRALRLAASYGTDHVLVVRRLTGPSTADEAFETQLSLGPVEETPKLPAPIEMVRAYADGREEPVRGLVFSGVDRRNLQDIAMAGPSHTATVLVPPAGSSPFSAGPLYGLPVTLTAPEVVLPELVLVPTEDRAVRPPPHPSPLATD